MYATFRFLAVLSTSNYWSLLHRQYYYHHHLYYHYHHNHNNVYDDDDDNNNNNNPVGVVATSNLKMTVGLHLNIGMSSVSS
jgi:hypothetical protein